MTAERIDYRMVYVLLVVGFICLIKGADFFVEGSASLAKKFRVPSLIIGLTIVAMGTSAPECAVSISAAVRGSNGMAISNIIGSNMFNLLMVCGCCAVVLPLTVKASSLKKEFPFSIIMTALLLGLGSVGMLVGRLDGIILLVLFVLFLWNMIAAAKRSREAVQEEEAVPEFSWWKCLISIVGGIAAIVLGGQLVVNSAEKIASNFGLSDTLIGLTVCAIGTSLPELVTSIVAAKKGEADMAIGNVIGSNIFNILLILGLTSVIHPVTVTMDNIIDLVILIAVSLMIMIMAIPKKRLNRGCGVIAIAVYIVYMVYICMR